MSDIHSFEPIWENWVLDKQIGHGSFGTVWRAHRQDPYSSVVQEAAVKHISIPRESNGDEDLFFSDRQSLQRYYDAQLSRLIVEIETMIRLSGHANIVSCAEHKVVPKRGEPGYDLFVRMELLTSLPDYVKQHGLPDQELVIKFGVDISKALEVLQKNRLIHRDIKPANLFVNAYGDFKLGDFGTARVLAGDSLASTHAGTPNYMAPEVYAGKDKYDHTVDIYSLGIVLYRYMNNGFLPFVTSQSAGLEEALEKRIQGMPLPPPSQADSELADIILKACAFRSKDRYQTATELREALEGVAKELASDAKQPVNTDITIETELQSSIADTTQHSTQNVTILAAPQEANTGNLPSSETNLVHDVTLPAAPQEANSGDLPSSETNPAHDVDFPTATQTLLSGNLRSPDASSSHNATIPASPQKPDVDKLPSSETNHAQDITISAASQEQEPCSDNPQTSKSIQPKAPSSGVSQGEESAPVKAKKPIPFHSFGKRAAAAVAAIVAVCLGITAWTLRPQPNGTSPDAAVMTVVTAPPSPTASITVTTALKPTSTLAPAQSTSPTATPSPASVQLPASDKSKLIADSDVLFDQEYNLDPSNTVLNGSILRSSVRSIHFTDAPSNALENAWDVSQARDGSVLAWTSPAQDGLCDLYIAGENGLALPEDCSYFFAGYTQLKEIDFGDCVSTENVINMSDMFSYCAHLTALNLSGFDTANVTNMRNMFWNCKALAMLDISSFDTAKVTDMDMMFAGCEHLSALDLSSFDTSSVTYMSMMFNRCEDLVALDLSNFDTANVTDMDGMFYSCESLTTLDLSSFDTVNVTYMSSMFNSCYSLGALDLSSFDTTNVTNMNSMFAYCELLTALDLSSFDTANVTDMDGMFYSCESLTSLDLSSFDTANVTDMDGMFYSCESLTSLDLSGFNTANVTDMGMMFSSCKSLATLDLSAFDTSKVKDMSSMFSSCESLELLDLSSFNTANVTDMSWMFSFCQLLTKLDLSAFNTASVTNMSWMFSSCESLTALDLSAFDTANVTDMSQMFSYCYSLLTLDLSSFDTANVTNMSMMFESCESLTALDLSSFDTVNVTDMSFMLSSCYSLERVLVSSGFITQYDDTSRMLLEFPASKLTVIQMQ